MLILMMFLKVTRITVAAESIARAKSIVRRYIVAVFSPLKNFFGQISVYYIKIESFTHTVTKSQIVLKILSAINIS